MVPILARLAAVAVVLAACDGSDAAVPEPSPSPTVAASPSPTAEPSPDQSPTEVLPANDVDDPVAALEAIVRYRDFLFEHPDPDKLSLIYAERCDCYEQLLPVIEGVRDDGQRLLLEDARAFEVVEVVERDGPFADIRYRIDEPGGRLIDATGKVIEVRDGDPALTERRALIVSEGGRWRVVAFV
jgi:hypothetical protein